MRRYRGLGGSVAVGVLLAAASGAARAAPDLDILASAGFGDELGGRPLAIGVTGEQVLVLGDQAGRRSLVRVDEDSGVAARVAMDGVDDLVVASGGEVVVVGGDGVAVFDASLALRWRGVLPGRGADEPRRRVALGEHGTVAALAGGGLYVYSADGRRVVRVALADAVTSGVAVHDGAGVVLTTGSSRRVVCGEAIDVVSLAAVDLDGEPRWRGYADAHAEGGCGDVAATRGVAVVRGADGAMYLLAEVEGRDNLFRGRPDQADVPAVNVAFDAYTDASAVQARQMAYYARFTPEGEHVLGQYLLLPEADAVVRPRAIAADRHGNVVVAGAADHSLGAADERAVSERLDDFAGFLQVVAPDFESRRLWQQLAVDGMRSELTALALADGRMVAVLGAAPLPGQAGGALPTGPSLLEWPGEFAPAAVEKHPDPETQGTFGFESGVSGSDPTCYCDAGQRPLPGALALLLGLLCLPRPGVRRRGP